MKIRKFLEAFQPKEQPQIQKAKGEPVKVAWMILSNKPEEIDKKIFLTDLFFEAKQDTLIKANTRKLWLVLSQNGFYLHPAIEKQYMKQRTCFFDGAEIVTKKADEGNYEEVCLECGYIYNEK